MSFREVKKAGWMRSGLFVKRYHFFCGNVQRNIGIPRNVYEEVLQVQREQPVMMMNHAGDQYWLFGDKVYQEDENLQAEDVEALVRQKERARERRLDRARQLLRAEEEPQENVRGGITREMRYAVWERDGGKCVDCGSTFELQFDHEVPVTMGGATTISNLRLTCAPCNQAKGGTLG